MGPVCSVETNDFEFRIRVNEKTFFERREKMLMENPAQCNLLMNKQQVSEILPIIEFSFLQHYFRGFLL